LWGVTGDLRMNMEWFGVMSKEEDVVMPDVVSILHRKIVLAKYLRMRAARVSPLGWTVF
jgi:hypothetical protein